MAAHDFKPSLKRATVLQIVALTIFASMLLFVGAEFQRTTLEFVDHANQVISAERELFRLTLDMETGLRGFQITGKPVFLQPYNEAAEVIDARFAALDRMIADDPSQHAQLASIHRSFNEWRQQATDTLRQRTGTAGPGTWDSDSSAMLESKASMDLLRKKFDALISSEVLPRNSKHAADQKQLCIAERQLRPVCVCGRRRHLVAVPPPDARLIQSAGSVKGCGTG